MVKFTGEIKVFLIKKKNVPNNSTTTADLPRTHEKKHTKRPHRIKTNCAPQTPSVEELMGEWPYADEKRCLLKIIPKKTKIWHPQVFVIIEYP